MLAAGIITVSSVAFIQALGQIAKSRAKSETLRDGLAVESQIISAFSDPLTFQGTSKTAQVFQTYISSGMKSTAPILVLQAPLPASVLQIGGKTCLDHQLNVIHGSPDSSSSGCNFGNPQSHLQVELAMNMNGTNVSYAYRIQPNTQLVTMQNFGVKTSGAFVPTDFVGIPAEVITAQSKQSCNPDNSPHPNFIGMYSYDRSSGNSVCISKPPDVSNCPAGQFSTGLVFNNNPSSPGFIFDCKPAPNPTPCPNGYSVDSVDPSKILLSASHALHCVPTTALFERGASYDSASGYVAGVFCPPNYKVNLTSSSCQVTGSTPVPGLGCPTPVTTMVCAPAVPPNPPVCAPVTTYVSNPVDPTTPPVGVASYGRTAREAVCQFAIPAQPCGASYTAVSVRFNAECVLDPDGQDHLQAAGVYND